MKKIVAFTIVCLLAAGMIGCEQNEREYFDTDYSALNIWVGLANAPAEALTYNFVTHNDMDAVTFYARISGKATGYDRTFTLEAVAGHIDKVEFFTQEYTIPAGEYSASFPIYFAKPANYSEFRYSEGYLVFKVKSDYFAEGARSDRGVNMNRLHFVFQNNVTKPYNWDSDTYPMQPGGLRYYFGSYSDVKYEFMIKTLGLTDIRPLVSGDAAEYPDNVYSHVEVNFFVTKCRSALSLFNADPANIASGKAPLTDEFGFPVSF